MNVPTCAGFVADFPDDEVATRQEIAVYGDRNVAVAVGEMFAGLECTDVSEPHYGGEVGWDFTFRYGARHSFWCRVQSFHPIYWLLLEGAPRKREAAAHVELWRKFADDLEQDPRFDQVLWRPFEEGPPDRDEFTVTDDLPPPTYLDEFPPRPTKPRPKAAGGSLARVIVPAWIALVVVTMIFVDNVIHGAKAQAEVRSLAIVGLLVGLAVVLRVVDHRRKRRRYGSDENRGSDA
ncbi:hypothetical protein [Phenylobacterium sp.]|uniref:hypothetical protein n=1 Tax=Phenylobacterium sp. TaxID=1871053 RepID=UPI0012190D10|nr:hypothetical protein [Phenylobacterium sp.]THD62421.1 MAG: hypothetical protein E8A49_07765 [Phenylobacterium sp.]